MRIQLLKISVADKTFGVDPDQGYGLMDPDPDHAIFFIDLQDPESYL